MQRVSLVEKEQCHPKVKELYQKIESNGVNVINLFKVMGHMPYIGLRFQQMGNAILRGEELTSDLRELAILRVGTLTQSDYELAQHRPIALECGVRQRQIDEVRDWTTSAEFDEREKAVLSYTDEVVQNIKVKDETFTKLKDFFNEHVIVELTTVIGFYCMVSRILVALQIEMEEGSSGLAGRASRKKDSHSL
ncbi:carboxymuconolactone decarboxylase family protein [Chloroflexota bacterium]